MPGRTVAVNVLAAMLLYPAGTLSLAGEFIGGVLSLAGTSDPSGMSRLLITTRYSPGGIPGSLSRLPASLYFPAASVLPTPPNPVVPSFGMNVTVAFANGWSLSVTVPDTGTRDGSVLPHPTASASTAVSKGRPRVTGRPPPGRPPWPRAVPAWSDWWTPSGTGPTRRRMRT